MVTPASGSGQQRLDERAQPPIRWPHPDRSTVGLIAVWAVGVIVALFVPALFVAPTAKNPPTGDVMLALGSTLVGSAIMIGVAMLLWRRKADSSILLMGLVPAVSCVAGGIILAASKLNGG
jgi:nitrate reductase gamma subunit